MRGDLMVALLLLACTGGSRETAAPTDSDTAGGDTASDDTATADSGVDSAPVDADGDGYTEGIDCDDTDAAVHPDAPDACDGVDRNCDGQVVDEGGCGVLTEVSDTYPVEFYREDHWPSLDCLWPTSEGDVVADHGSFAGTKWGGWGTYGWAGSNLEMTRVLAERVTDAYVYCTVVGDFDGDGHSELALHGSSRDEADSNNLALISGNRATWSTDTVDVANGALALWNQITAGDGFSERITAGDVDGDGLVDVIAHAPINYEGSDDYGGTAGWLFVLPGRTEGFPTGGSIIAMPDEWRYPHRRDRAETTPLDEAFEVEYIHPDLDGDGLADLVGQGWGYSYVVIPGANLVSMQDAYIDELVDYDVTFEDDYSWEAASDWDSGGDYDGDGVADTWMSLYREDNAALVIVSGAAVRDGATPLNAALTTVGTFDHALSFGWNLQRTADVDGDGFPDLALTGGRIDGESCLIASSRQPRAGVLAAEDLAPCWWHQDEVSYLNGASAGDLDGNGIPDLVLAQRGASDARFPLFVLPDLVLPWDDPTRW